MVHFQQYPVMVSVELFQTKECFGEKVCTHCCSRTILEGELLEGRQLPNEMIFHDYMFSLVVKLGVVLTSANADRLSQRIIGKALRS